MRIKNTVTSGLFIFYIAFCFLSTSCSSSKSLDTNPIYFRDGPDTVASNQYDKIILPSDLLSIQVYSKTPNQEQAIIFNIFSQPSGGNRESGSSGSSSTGGSASSSMQGYRVNESGNIEMPVIGTVSTTGLTIYQLQDYLIQKISNYVKSPAVIVHYLQFDVNVLGEVKAPGIKKFGTDRVTVLDALGASGDLTDFGKRNDVTVIRREGGKQVFYKLDLRNRNVFKSPVYNLQPNDIVYVGPDNHKLENLTINQKSQTKIAIVFGLVGIALSVATLIVSFNRH